MLLHEQLLFDGRYKLIKRLGNFRFSEVWLAVDTFTAEKLTLNVISSSIRSNKENIELLRYEFAKICDLNHPNLTKYTRGRIFVEQPYLVGPYYNKRYAKELIGNCSERKARKFLHDVAAGLAHLHGCYPPIIHQNIRPDTVLLEENDFVIINFGIHSEIYERLSSNTESKHMFQGGHPYTPPEMFSSDPIPSEAGDVWALGASIYEILTGRMPFGQRGGEAQLAHEAIPTISSDYSDDLKEIVQKCLSFNPYVRPTAAEIEKIAYNTGKILRDTSTDNPIVKSHPSVEKKDTPIIYDNKKKTERFTTPAPHSEDQSEHKSYGASNSDHKHCGRCGARLVPGMNMCPVCGIHIDTPPAPQASNDTIRFSAVANDTSCISNKKTCSIFPRGENKLQSTVYAPKEAKKGEEFIVSVFLHKSEDSDNVEIIAKAIDDSSEKRNTKRMTAIIKKGDTVEFQLSVPKQQSDSFRIDKRTKGFVWDGDINNVEFIVSVSKECSVSSFVGNIKICVNKKPMGDMAFKTTIVEQQSSSGHGCADFVFIPFDKKSEMDEAHRSLVKRLSDRIRSLDEQLQGTQDGLSNIILRDLEMCKKCKELLEGTHKHNSNGVLRVFISSTSDMRPFRQIVKERVEACEMYPDMYENWGQGNDYPRDMCCKHVLQSDIFVSILGAKYGFIEPLWDTSMTEIEYRIAQSAGLPILIYIIENYKEEMDKLVAEERQNAYRQEKFIDEVKNNRVVGIFPDEAGLELKVTSELRIVKHDLQS